MPTLTLLVGLASAIAFFRAAQYERMSPLLWTVASLGLTLVASFLVSGVLMVILAQIGLFAVMWWYNARRPVNHG
ncbi:MAG: hypothetical protein WD801_11290 [Gemmatimonadaceae bacterium]